MDEGYFYAKFYYLDVFLYLFSLVILFIFIRSTGYEFLPSGLDSFISYKVFEFLGVVLMYILIYRMSVFFIFRSMFYKWGLLYIFQIVSILFLGIGDESFWGF